MKRWSLRAIGLGSVALVGCAAIANLQDPGPPEDNADAVERGDASTAPPSPTSSSTGSPVTFLDGGDAAVLPGDGGTVKEDVKPTPVTCPNDAGALKNGDRCTQPSQCCSGVCDENEQCDTSCTATGQGCNALATGECCLGNYCSPGAFPLPQCARCLKKDVPAETVIIFGQTVALSRSCCSGSVKNGMCQ